jgi:hypothetical protein
VHPVETENGALEASARGVDATLLPEDDDLLGARGDDSRLEPPLGRSRLEWSPRLFERRTLGAARPRVGKRRRPQESRPRMEELLLARLVASLDGVEAREHDLDGLLRLLGYGRFSGHGDEI